MSALSNSHTKERNIMTLRKISAVLLMTAILFGATSAVAADYKTKLSLTVPKTEANTSYDEAYVLEVPADFTITAAGWNELGKIKISHATDSGDAFSSAKKVVVTAVSANNWNLVMSGDTTQTIGYTLKTAKDDTAATTEFTFTAEQINNGASQDIGVDVEDYTAKKAGDYEDEITYEVSVENAVTTKTVTFISSTGGTTINKDGVTCNNSFDQYNNLPMGGTFSTTTGKFTKIEVTASDTSMTGMNSSDMSEIEGWETTATSAIWTGSASSVTFGTIMGNNQPVAIVFTIEE